MITIKQGDCLELMKEIPDKSIDLILTDPPYGMNFQSNFRKEKYKKINNDENLLWIDDFLKESYRVLKDNTCIYIFCSWHNVDIFKKNIEKYFKIKNIIIWVKNNTSMGDLKGSYAPKYEMIIFAHKGRRLMNGFRYPDVIEAKRTNNKLHPTQKPIELLEKFIMASSNENDIVLDPFTGSGSTGVACQNTNRNFIGFELDEKYFEIAKERLGLNKITEWEDDL